MMPKRLLLARINIKPYGGPEDVTLDDVQAIGRAFPEGSYLVAAVRREPVPIRFRIIDVKTDDEPSITIDLEAPFPASNPDVVSGWSTWLKTAVEAAIIKKSGVRNLERNSYNFGSRDTGYRRRQESNSNHPTPNRKRSMKSVSERGIRAVQSVLSEDADLRVGAAWKRENILFQIMGPESMTEVDHRALGRRFRIVGEASVVGSAVDGMPILDGYNGPFFGGMQGGLQVVRYESKAVAAMLGARPVTERRLSEADTTDLYVAFVGDAVVGATSLSKGKYKPYWKRYVDADEMPDLEVRAYRVPDALAKELIDMNSRQSTMDGDRAAEELSGMKFKVMERRVREGGQPLWVAFIEDSVYGASDDHKAVNPRYWPIVSHDPDFSVRLYRNVPDELAQDLIAGSGDLVFSDGYEAAKALRGLSNKVVWSNE